MYKINLEKNTNLSLKNENDVIKVIFIFFKNYN